MNAREHRRWQSRMDYPEKLATLCTHDTGKQNKD